MGDSSQENLEKSRQANPGTSSIPALLIIRRRDLRGGTFVGGTRIYVCQTIAENDVAPADGRGNSDKVERKNPVSRNQGGGSKRVSLVSEVRVTEIWEESVSQGRCFVG